MSKLNKSQILGVDTLRTMEIEVPEWNGTIAVRELTGAKRDIYEGIMLRSVNSAGNVTSLKGLRAKLIVMSVIDDEGNLMFTDKDLDAITSKSGYVIDRISEQLTTFNHLKEEAAKDDEGN